MTSQPRAHTAHTAPATPGPSLPTPASSPTPSGRTLRCEVLVIGAGPGGSAAAYHAAKAGREVLLVDMAAIPTSPEDTTTRRDKTCGDGLTPRAVGELAHMDALHLLDGHPHIRGLKLHGFGGSVTAPWPQHLGFPARGSAVSRADFDAALVRHALRAGAQALSGCKLTTAEHSPAGISAVHGTLGDGTPVTIRPQWVILAEGVRSTIGRQVGVEWLRGMVHGVAARAYATSPHGVEPWIHSHLELRDDAGVAQPGYGWVFPLGAPVDSVMTPAGEPAVNVGCGALTTAARPARINTKKLLRSYAESIDGEWHFGPIEHVTSALLPMGGAVTRTAGRNWAAIGDAAALVNPLNGEGIDYALESARLLVGVMDDARLVGANDGLRTVWPAVLREHYGRAFSLARRLALGLTMPGLLAAVGPVGMRGPWSHGVMSAAARLMGNLVTPEDEDLTARVWRAAGALSVGADRVFAADARPLFGRSLR